MPLVRRAEVIRMREVRRRRTRRLPVRVPLLDGRDERIALPDIAR